MTAPDLTALADKLDELAMKATADTWYIVGYDDSHCLVDSDDDEPPIAETVEYRNAKLICELRNALPQITAALREAARMREALEKIQTVADNERMDATDTHYAVMMAGIQATARAALESPHG